MNKILIGKRDRQGVYVSIDGLTLFPFRSQQVCNHSPTGFEWGYGGSGPSQLALAILLELYDQKTAQKYYQAFKREFIATAPFEGFIITSDVIDSWIKEQDNEFED